MRTLVVLAVLGASAAHADDKPTRLHGYARTSGSLGIITHGGFGAGGWGPHIEGAIGRSRLQYFVEASFGTAKLDDLVDGKQVEGNHVRGGAGVRWLARSHEVDDHVALDMHFEAFAAVSRFHFDGMDPDVRPEVGVGVGYAWRIFWARQIVLRFTARVYVSPTDRDAVIACRGTACPSVAESQSQTGLMAVFGVQL